MTTNPNRHGHPGQDDRRDNQRLRTKTNPDRATWSRLTACAPSKTEWKPGPR